MNINENIRNKRKLVEQLMGYTSKISSAPAANYLIPTKFGFKKQLRQSHLTKMIKYTNYLIEYPWILM